MKLLFHIGHYYLQHFFLLNEGKEAEGWKHNNGGQWIGEGGEKITLATMGPKGSTMEGTNQFDYDGHTTGEGTQPSTVFLPSFLPSFLPCLAWSTPSLEANVFWRGNGRTCAIALP